MTDPAAAAKAELEARDKRALVEKNEADARKAEADARKAEADARKADADARQAEATAADLESADGVLARAAKSRQSAAEADQKAATAQQAQLSAMIPDISKVKESTLAVDAAGPAIGGGTLTFGGLADAADAIADGLKPPKDATWRILVTSDPDLASADAVHLDVTEGLQALDDAAIALLAETSPTAPQPQRPRRRVRTSGFVETATLGLAAGPAVAAVATAIPAVLSLLSAERSLATKAVTVSDLAAAAAVAGAIVAKRAEKATVVHDDFRLVVGGAVQQAASSLARKRIDLVARKLEIIDRKSGVERELELAKAELKDAEKAVDDAAPTPGAGLVARRETARTRVASLQADAKAITARLSLVESLLATIDAFVAAIRVVPTGGRRTPLATAALYQALHDTTGTGFTHALLVRAQPAQSAQLTNDKPLMFADKFSVMVEVSVTYMLIAADTSHVVKAGTATALAMAHGTLGDTITFNVRTPVVGVDGPAGQPQLRGRSWQPVQMVGDLTTDD